MKSRLQIMMIATTLLAAACTYKVEKYEPKPVTVPDIKVELPDLSKIGVDSPEAKIGGQPGTIYLSKTIAVKDEAGVVGVSDSRIELELIGGQGVDGMRPEVERQKATSLIKESASAQSIEKKLQKENRVGTFINISCPNVDPQLTEGLRQTKMKLGRTKEDMVAVAEKIFICGQGQSKMGLVSLTAKEIHMTDASYTLKPSLFGLLITTNKLFLSGKNRLATQGVQSSISGFMIGSIISLDVADSVEGEGSLVLSSTGASYKRAKGLPGDK